jgi:predicted nucleotidyltransferase
MRKRNLANVLFPKTRQGILAATYGQPERWWYLSELAALLRTSPSSLQREVESLSGAGVLRKKRDGNRIYFQAESDSPIFDSLYELVKQTLGVVPALSEVISPYANKILCAFVYGSVAHAREHSLSDVDLLVVGSVGLAELTPVFRELEKKFNREFNASCYKAAEFINKVEKENHFLTEVLKNEKIFIVGGENELDKLTVGAHGSNARDQQE